MSRRRKIKIALGNTEPESDADRRIRAAVGDVVRITRDTIPTWPTPRTIVIADALLSPNFNIDDWMNDYEAFSKTQQRKEQEVKTARNAKPRPTKATMTSHAQFKRDEELFPRLRIHRKHRAVVWFGCREGGLCVHAGAQDSPFVFSQVVDVGGRLKYGDFDDYVGTIVLSNT